MNKKPKESWIADLKTMTCRNKNTNIVVTFEKKRNIFLPKIKDIPVELHEEWSQMKDREKEKIISEAEDVFMKAFIEHDLGAYPIFCVNDRIS